MVDKDDRWKINLYTVTVWTNETKIERGRGCLVITNSLLRQWATVYVCVGLGALIMKGYCCTSDSVNLTIVLARYLPCWGESGKPTWQHSLPTDRHRRLTHTHSPHRDQFPLPVLISNTTQKRRKWMQTCGENNFFCLISFISSSSHLKLIKYCLSITEVQTEEYEYA